MCGCESHWKKDVRCTCACPEHEHIRKHYAELDEWDRTHKMEEGRQLANERDNLIARGVDPSLLEIPLAPPGME